MHVRIDHRWRVHARHAFDLPMSAEAMWEQMRDFKRFITLDPLHTKVTIIDQRAGKPADSPRGVEMLISHRLLGIGPDRRARMVYWREGRGFAFSDLSKRGVQVGFPHVCMYDLTAKGERTCTLAVSARGRWTARWVPKPLVKLWLAWVLLETQRCIEIELSRLTAHTGTRALRRPSSC